MASAAVSEPLRTCQTAVERKAWSNAIDACKKATEVDGHDHESWLFLGIAQQQLQHSNDAIASFQRSIELKESPRARYLLGCELALLGRTDEALHSLNRAVDLQPNSGPAWRELAHVEYDRNHLEPALVALNRAAELLPDDPVVHDLFGVLQKKLKSRGLTLEAVSHFIQAHSWLQEGKGTEAEAEFAKAVALAPKYAEAHYDLAELVRDHHDLDRAEAEYRAAIVTYVASERLSMADAENNLADLLVERGKKLSEAEQLVRSAIAVRGERVAYLDTLARACDAEKKRDCAVPAFEKLLSHERELPPEVAQHARQRLQLLRR